MQLLQEILSRPTAVTTTRFMNSLRRLDAEELRVCVCERVPDRHDSQHKTHV